MTRIKVMGMALVLATLAVVGLSQRAQAADGACMNRCGISANICYSLGGGAACGSQLQTCLANCGR
jgi:hypothetical protein